MMKFSVESDSMRVFPNVSVLAASSFLLMGVAGMQRDAVAGSVLGSPAARDARRAIVNHVVTLLDGRPMELWSLRGKVLLIVNTKASCDSAPEMASLERLYRRYREHGLVVIGAPSDEFDALKDAPAEQAFCRRNYGVTFPMLAHTAVKGARKSPLFRTLTEETEPGIRGEIRSDFTKFLVDGRGEVIARFEPEVDPLAGDVIDAVERALP